MKTRIKHITSKIALAIIIVGLAVALPLPRLNAGPSGAPSALQGDQAVQQLKQLGLYDSLQEAVAATRYELRWEDRPALNGLAPAYHAPNPAHRLSGYFTSDGLHLAPQKMPSEASDQAEWRATMTLIGYGYGENLLSAGVAELQARGNRIAYRRAGLPLTEWYVNKPEGLEQGFTLDTAPGTRSEGERLRLALEVTGDLRAELTEGGQAAALKQADGTLALNYRGLHAYDAQGRALPAHMRVSDGQVILEVDDEKAVYPVTIDPTFTQQAKLTGHPVAGDYFGYSVAIYLNTAVVGVPNDDIGANADQGSAYVFVRSGSTWSLQAILTDSNFGAAHDGFGQNVAIYSDTVVVGAPGHDNGSVYVFVRSGSMWSQQAILTASSGTAYDGFGSHVAISGNTVVVGAPYANGWQGSAYVFVRSSAGWNQQAQLTANDGAANDLFGNSVAIGGNTVVVGACFDDIDANAYQGSTYVFLRFGASWSQQAKLTASDGAPGDYFGSSVAISGTGNRVVVGASADDIVANGVTKADQGSAYVFVRSCFGCLYSQEAKLTASDGAAGDKFGMSVAIGGYEVVVGAPWDDIGNNDNQGSAYVFLCNGTCGQSQKLTASDPTPAVNGYSDLFGYSVAINAGTPSTIVVGAILDDIMGWLNLFNIPDAGSAYVFSR